MVRPSWASSRRRARVRLSAGGESRRIGGMLLVGEEQGRTPEQTDQGEMAMQAGPGAPLVVAQTQLLLAILMEAFDGPAAMAELELAIQGGVVQAPGEIPLGLARPLRVSAPGRGRSPSNQPWGPVTSPWPRWTRRRQAWRSVDWSTGRRGRARGCPLGAWSTGRSARRRSVPGR